MKKIILLVLAALIMVGCKTDIEKDTKFCTETYHVIILDSCEYYSHTYKYDLTHKGNCRFCKERRHKELEDWATKLKEK